MTQLIFRLAMVLAFLLLPGIAHSADEPSRTLSPYFVVNGGNPDVESLPLKETKATVDIAGVIAKVVVTQTYSNEGKTPIEAIYVFPGSTRAAVMGMEMQVGERKIKARIETRKDASKIYKKALAAGKTASLLEQERPNVFKMKVANIMPNDTVVVRLEYVEALIPQRGIYEFVYPTVVGPRYSGESSAPAPGEKWVANPHTQKGQAPTYAWDLEATIRSGIAIRGLRSGTHKLNTRFLGAKVAHIDVDDKTGGNRDFVLRYRLTGQAIETGVMLFPGDTKSKEKFFLAMVQPPSMQAKVELPAREYIFIVDVSGSMGGFPMATTRSVMKELFKGLRPKDRLNLMMFAGGSNVLAPRSLSATPANIQKAMAALDGTRGSGSTRILQALQTALAMKRNGDLATTFVVLTDGYVSVEKEAFGLIRKNLGKANLFSFGIGSSVNRHLVDGMARAGRGQSFVALNSQEAKKKAKSFASYISSPVLTNVKLKFEGFDAYDVVPKKLPDVFSQRPLLVFGKYRGAMKGRLLLSGTTGKGETKMTVDLTSQGKESKNNQALRYLWARDRIQELEDGAAFAGKKSEESITKLGLKYKLMTAYTSFVAVDERVRNKSGAATKTRQTLPLPAGVPNSAIGSGTATGALSGIGYGSGLGDRDVYGGLSGSGGWGYGVSGIGAGGGGTGWGTIGSGYGSGGTGTRMRARKAKPPTVAFGKSTVRGSLDSNIIKRYIRRKLSRIRHCYEKELLTKPKLAGKIVISFLIGSNGKVLSVQAKGLGNKNLKSCIGNAIKSIVFPKVKGGGTVKVSYPFTLSAQ